MFTVSKQENDTGAASVSVIRHCAKVISPADYAGKPEHSTMNNEILAALAAALNQTQAANHDTASGRCTHTVCRKLRAYKSESGIHKGKWMLSAGDVKVEWRSSLVPGSELLWSKDRKYRETVNDWELTYTTDRLGNMRGVSASDTGIAYQTETLDEPEETLDDSPAGPVTEANTL